MKKILFALALLLGANIWAQTDEQPIITFHTNAYAEDGDVNVITMQIGSTEAGEYIDVDCGYGKVETELEQAYVDTAGIAATLIECHVSPEGIVRIFGNASKIDVFNGDGCNITDISFADDLVLDVLSLNHNALERLDLSKQTKLMALYLYDNPFDKEALNVPAMENLVILDMGQVENISPEFTLTKFPQLISFDAYHSLSLTQVDPTQCPELTRLSLDMTSVQTVDVTKNPKLSILNVNDTRVTSLDLSNNPKLTQLYVNHSSGTLNKGYKFDQLDLTHNPILYYLFCAGNNLTTLDISQCPYLFTLSAPDNKLTSLDVTNNPDLYSINLTRNNMDFATLPLPQDTWYKYYYDQNDLPVAKAYKEGDVIDLSARVYREGTSTLGTLYSVSASDPTTGVEVESDYYTWDESGKLTVLKPISDSLYIEFANSAFEEYNLRTTRFVVKSAEEYGQPNAVVTFSTSMPTGYEVALCVGIAGASTRTPKEFYVDFGDGNLQTFQCTVDGLPGEPNASMKRPDNGPVIIYMAEGNEITGLRTQSMNNVNSVDVSKAASLRYLLLPNIGIYSINLSYNRCLEKLDLSGNNLRTFSQKGTTGYFYKSMLHDINLSNNQLISYEYDDMYATHYINLSNNQLTELNFSDADNIITCNLSNNLLSELYFNYSSSMTDLDVSNNQLTLLYVPENNALQRLNVSNNQFTLANLPEHYGMDDAHYIYAPQQNIRVASKGIGADLSSQYVTIDGHTTQFAWYTTSGTQLQEGTDYTNNEGMMRFKTVTSEPIYCVISNAAYPSFQGDKCLRTTNIQPIEMPTNIIASFTTTQDGENVELSMAAKSDDISVYFDWAGDGMLTQYTLTTTYQTFSATTHAGVNVKVYVADKNERLNVLSIDNASMTNFDASNLSDLFALMLIDAGLTELNLPANNSLTELNLTNNKFSDFDLSKYPSLIYANLCSNKLSSIDLSKNQELQVAYFTNNQITDVKFNNKALWGLDLGYNKLTQIDFTGAPNIQQLVLEGNQFASVDVDNLNGLMVLNISGNYLDFSTIPQRKDNWYVYYYGNQAPVQCECIDGVVDLSRQAMVGETATVYRWFIDEVSLNDDGELEGEELIEGEEYTVEGGVVTFLTTLDNVCCVMTNAALPDIYLCTPFINVTTVGISAPTDNINTPLRYDLQGRPVSSGYKGLVISNNKKFMK